MKLSTIIKSIDYVSLKSFNNVNIKCLSLNAKDCEKGSIFFCIVGERFDGHNFVLEAINNGAVAIICEKEISNISVPQILVKSSRIAMAQVSKRFYNNASDKLKIISVIGTNGKTTTSFIISNILKSSGKSVAVIGTNGVYINDICLPCNLTTPDPIELHYIFNTLVNLNIEYVVMEISAHAIAHNKVFGIKSEICVFTNISNEHLDFFKTMENYANTKVNYFNNLNMNKAVINVDDYYGRQIYNNSNVLCITYGLGNPANVFGLNIKTSLNGSSFIINLFDSVLKINTPLIGDYNVYNTMAAIVVARLLGVSEQTIISSLKTLPIISGRFNVFKLKNNNKIIVDFAHTPDGFEKMLSNVRKMRKGKLIVVFGATSYSDDNKRKLMGEIADKYSDIIIITTDNIDNENFYKICNSIKIGIKNNNKIKCVESRVDAIKLGYKCLNCNDTLLLLGKGAENYQLIKGQKIKYSDLDEVEKIIKKEKYNESCIN